MSTSDLAVATEQLNVWLMSDALPLWWARGADQKGGGFYEAIYLSGEPADVDRRARVQARQVYSYAMAGKLGWDGPWKVAMEHGLDFLLKRYRRDDGLFRTLVHPDGTPADDTVWIYDQAFALLALAEAVVAGSTRGDLRSIAREVVEAMNARRLAFGGFLEASREHPIQANCHMHLLEASLAWREIDTDTVWDKLADEIVELCLAKFIDKNGALHEFFGNDWSLAPGVDGRIVEPGHQCEWAWLLERWSRLRNRSDAHLAAQRMFEIASNFGFDRERGVAINELLDDFTVHQPSARLWPQTERIKAAVILAESAGTPESRESYLAEAVTGAEGLRKYLDVAVPGLWRDKMKPDGSLVDEPAPASSFYHIVCAISQLHARV